jgi:hypothetical protein
MINIFKVKNFHLDILRMFKRKSEYLTYDEYKQVKARIEEKGWLRIVGRLWN